MGGKPLPDFAAVGAIQRSMEFKICVQSRAGGCTSSDAVVVGTV